MNSWTMLRALAVLGGLFFLAPSAALAHHCKGAHANYPGCDGGGGGGDGEPSLDVIFRCSDNGVDRSCAPTGTDDRIQGDGGGPFMDGSQKVEAILTSFGRFRLNTGGNKKNGSDRNVYWDFREGGTSSVPLEAAAGGQVSHTDSLGFPYRTVIHLNRRNDIADLREIPVDPVNPTYLDMWGDVVVSDGGSTSSILIRFDAAGANNECQGTNTASQDVPVTRVDDNPNTWLVDVPIGTLACVVVSDSNAGTITYAGDYMMGPFQFQIVEQP